MEAPENHYLLIDLENVPHANVGLLDKASIRVLVFVGASQSKLNFDLVQAIQQRGALQLKGNKVVYPVDSAAIQGSN